MRFSRQRAAAAVAALVLALTTGPLAALDQKASDRLQVGTSAPPAGSLVSRAPGAHDWVVVRPDAAVETSDRLLALPGEQASVIGADGAVRITLWGNLPAFSSEPVLESSVVFHKAPEGGVDLNLEAGRIVLAGLKENRAVPITVHWKDQQWTVTPDGAGSEVALALYSGWPAGTPVLRQPDPDERPAVAVVVWALKGQADLAVRGQHFRITEPPGPAYFHWDSLRGPDAVPQKRDQLPGWARSHADDPGWRQALDQQRQRLAEKPLRDALSQGLNADSGPARQLAVYSLAAIDDLAAVVDALASPQHAEMRQAAVRALQHWLGRGPREDAELFRFLTTKRDYTPVQAEIVIQLLHGLGQQDRDQPETYDTLIEYLSHRKLAVRQLARDQLDEWVPQGRSIAYDPAGSEAERERGYQAWRQLIPRGKLPPAPRPR